MANERLEMTTQFKVLNSLWILVLFVPLGLTAYLGFFFIGIKTNNRKWLITGFIYLLIIVGGFYFIAELDDDHPLSDVFVWVLLMTWIACIVHSMSIRQTYLNVLFKRKLAYQYGLDQMNDRKVVESKSLETQTAIKGQTLGKMIVDKEEGQREVKPQVININKATEAEISALPSIHPFLAKSIITARNEVKQFKSVEHLAKVVNIQPHILSKSVPYMAFTDDNKALLEAEDASKLAEEQVKKTGRLVDY